MWRGKEYSPSRRRRRVTAVTSVALLAMAGGLLGHGDSAQSPFATDGKNVPAAAHPVTLHGPSVHWAGYGFRSSGPIDAVSATIKVPKMSCFATGFSEPANNPHAQQEDGLALWAGVTDGQGTDTTAKNGIAQAGVLMDCPGGILTIRAWTEEYPAGTQPADLGIKMGDIVVITVKANSKNGFDFSVTDKRNGRSVRTSAPCPDNTCPSTLAAVVAERQGYFLPKFSTIIFRKISVDSNGHSVPLAPSVVYGIPGVNYGNQNKVLASPTSMEGNSFEVLRNYPQDQ